MLQISPDNMPVWQQNMKRLLDVALSAFVLVVFFPLYLFLGIGVKLSGKGPILYSHNRIGRYGKPFRIYKFRSMRTDAEKDGPALSAKDDPRITPFGRFMRKYRMDEMPQFYNVLIGEMSIVGPRPERQYYIDKIVKRSPEYLNLHRIRPGITSLGQVKFGYAENVDEMIQRLRYDILYLHNMSLYLDLKILLQTILVVLGRKGV
jgi:lipopolysaccharide/colanic/teichoic acid biosynthesis glycosyltransferase